MTAYVPISEVVTNRRTILHCGRRLLRYRYLLDLVLSHHHHSQRAHCGQGAFERVDEIVVQVQEYQARNIGQVGNLRDQVVLVVEQPQPAVPLWTMTRQHGKIKKMLVSELLKSSPCATLHERHFIGYENQTSSAVDSHFLGPL